MDKIFSILKSKCNTRQQRLAFNQLIKSFVEYQSLDDMWDSIFKNGEFKGNTKAKGGTVQGKHMSIYIKFKGDKGAYQVVDNSNGTTVSQGKVDRSGKKEPLSQSTKESDKPKENTKTSNVYQGNKDFNRELNTDLSYDHAIDNALEPEQTETLKRISEFFKDENGKVNVKDIVVFDDPEGAGITEDNYSTYLKEKPQDISEEIPLGKTKNYDHGNVKIITTKDGNRLLEWSDSGGFSVIYALDPTKNSKPTKGSNTKNSSDLVYTSDIESDKVINLDPKGVDLPESFTRSPNGLEFNSKMFLSNADSMKSLGYSKKAIEDYETISKAYEDVDKRIKSEIGDYYMVDSFYSDNKNIHKKLLSKYKGTNKNDVNSVGPSYWYYEENQIKKPGSGADNIGYKIIDIGGVKVAALYGGSNGKEINWAIPVEHAEKVYKYLSK